LILADDPSQLINELITDQSIEFNKVICCVMDHVAQIQSQRKIQYLAEIIGRTCFEKKSLVNIDHQVNCLDSSEENSLKRTFIKNVFSEIGCLIVKSEVAALNNSFLTAYARLCAIGLF
ncbi:unnamed protein product, partial [Rotaria magnacalcarata]